MKNNSIISVINKQNLYYEENKIEFIVAGRYFLKDGKYYIIYKNYKDSDFDNAEGICSIKVENPDLITIIKMGTIQSKLILEKQKRHYSRYKTEYGVLNMGFYTENIECEMEEHSAKIKLKYSIDINSNLISDNEIYINVKRNDKEDVKYTDNGN